MLRFKLITLLTISVFCFACGKNSAQQNTSKPKRPTETQTAQPSNTTDNLCNLSFKGTERKAVKLRKPGLPYPAYNGGSPITVTHWFDQLLCTDKYNYLNPREFSDTEAHSSEQLTITITAWILLVKLEDDNDYHIQVADGREWSLANRQVIVEIPAEPEFCTARQDFEEILRRDKGRVSRSSKRYYFKKPRLALITGYLFLDAPHSRKNMGPLCQEDGGRGVRGSAKEVGQKFDESPVQGLWEIHPVTSIRLLQEWI